MWHFMKNCFKCWSILMINYQWIMCVRWMIYDEWLCGAQTIAFLQNNFNHFCKRLRFDWNCSEWWMNEEMCFAFCRLKFSNWHFQFLDSICHSTTTMFSFCPLSCFLCGRKDRPASAAENICSFVNCEKTEMCVMCQK